MEVGDEHLRVAHDIENDRVTLLVGVERVEDIARLDIEPTHITGAARARHDADTGWIARVPPVLGRCPQGRRYRDGSGLPGIEGHREVVEHHVVLGQREVVHHRAAGDLDVHGVASAPVDADDRVLHAVASTERVGHRVQFPAVRVPLRVCGVTTSHGAVEVASSDGVQVVIELVVGIPAFYQCECAAGVAQHAGIGSDQLQPSLGGGWAGWGFAERSRHSGVRIQRLRYHCALPSRRRTL